jgi:hypothetical protein
MDGPPPRPRRKRPPSVPANVQSPTDAPPTPAPDALAQENQPPLGAADTPPVHSPELDSPTLVPDTGAATATGALFSTQDRQRRLTSLLHHLTLDPGALDQDLPMAAPLPALWAGERRARTGWQFAWLFVLAGVTGALVGWGTVFQLPHLVHDSLPQENTELPVAASVQSTTGVPPLVRDSLPQENTEPPVTASVQSTREAAPVVHDSLPQENAEPPVTASVQSATEAAPLVHDRLPQENTEPPVAANVQSTTGAPPLVHDSLPQQNAEPPVAANAQSTIGAPPVVHDNLPPDSKPPLRVAATSPVQAQKSQLSQSLGSPPVLDADEIAALLQRGKDFAAHGDLISARLLLRRAAEAGSGEAALALGETFDPLVFQRLGVIGIKPDAATARKWYHRAAELGSPIPSQYLAKPDRAR